MSDEEKDYSKREVDMLIKPILDSLLKQDEVLLRIEAQTMKTNGRVTKLETTTSDYEKLKSNVASLSGYKQWILGFSAAITCLAGFVIYFIKANIDYQIKDYVGIAVNAAFDERFESIEVVK